MQDVLISAIVNGELKEGDNIDTYLDKIQDQITENKILYDEMQAQIADFPNHAPQREAAKQAYEAGQEKLRLEEVAKKQAEQAIKDAEAAKASQQREAERQKMIAWAKEHGSRRLHMALEKGYRCKKVYEMEYGRWLLQDNEYEYDRDDVTVIKEHACPSLESLEEVEKVMIWEGVDAIVVWLPEGLTELHKDEAHNEPECGCQAVRVDVMGTPGYWYKTF